MENKKLIIEIDIAENNTPTNWNFSPGVSGIESLAMWVMIKRLAKNQIDLLMK